MEIKKNIHELRAEWAKAWGITPHALIGRAMLEKTIKNKKHQVDLTIQQQEHLKKLIKEFKRNPECFNERIGALKPGTRLVRIYNGKKHNVLVKVDGFEYKKQVYFSLSKIANEITGTRWNGWVFFGIKKEA